MDHPIKRSTSLSLSLSLSLSHRLLHLGPGSFRGHFFLAFPKAESIAGKKGGLLRGSRGTGVASARHRTFEGGSTAAPEGAGGVVASFPLGFAEEESMEAESWSRVPAPSRRQQAALQSRFDLYVVDGGEEDPRAEFPCPFCAEEFDMVGLCCHIDDVHPVATTKGVCPICEDRVGMDMLGHIMMLHGNYFKMQHRRRMRKASSMSQSMLSLLKKEFREGQLQTLLGGSSHIATNSAPDPLLSSFIFNLPEADSYNDAESKMLDEGCQQSKTMDKKVAGSAEPSLPDEDLEEKARRLGFVQGLVLSSLFRDIL